MKLINPTDDELNAAFAVAVAGYVQREGGWEIPPMRAIWTEPLDFTRSMDAVLPLMEKAGAWAADWCPIISNREAAYKVWLRKSGIEAVGPTLPRACVIALLRANGVEVVCP